MNELKHEMQNILMHEMQNKLMHVMQEQMDACNAIMIFQVHE